MGKVEIILSIIALATILIGLWPIGLTIFACEAVYLIIKGIIKFTAKTVYEEKAKARQKYNVKESTKKPFTQEDFERWKQEKGGFVDLDELGKLFHWGIA